MLIITVPMVKEVVPDAVLADTRNISLCRNYTCMRFISVDLLLFAFEFALTVCRHQS